MAFLIVCWVTVYVILYLIEAAFRSQLRQSRDHSLVCETQDNLGICKHAKSIHRYLY